MRRRAAVSGREGIVSAEKRFQGTSACKIPPVPKFAGEKWQKKRLCSFPLVWGGFGVILDIVCEKALV